MKFEVQILGSNSAMSSHGRHPSSQLVKILQNTFLIDCGEGTQFQLQKFKCKPFKINCIFISHLHGDHYFGLIGLLTTYQLLKRESKLTIVCPPQLNDIIDLQLDVANSALTYPIEYVFTQNNHEEVVYENEEVIVKSFPLLHRIPCTGFLFREKITDRKLDTDAIKHYRLSFENFRDLKKGKNIVDEDGISHAFETLTLECDPPRSYAYCSDTIYLPSIVPIIKDVDLLYHETTFIHSALDRAIVTFHSTTIQAAQIAKQANAKNMIIGHFSSKYGDLNELLEECKSVFPNTELCIEGAVYEIPKRSEF